MINELIGHENICKIANKRYNDDNVGYDKYHFERGMDLAEKLIINAFYKSCDNLNINYDQQEKILLGIKNYLIR